MGVLDFLRTPEPATPEATSHAERLEHATRDAHILLKFAVEGHKSISPKVIDDLVDTADKVQAQLALAKAVPAAPLEPAVEKAFWNAYEALGEAVAPVTARSIAASNKQLARLINVTFPYALLALVIFGLVVFFQWRWFDGTTLRKNLVTIEEDIGKRDEAVRKKTFEVTQIRQRQERATARVDPACEPDVPGAKPVRPGTPMAEACKTVTLQIQSTEDQLIVMEEDLVPLKRDLERAQVLREPRVDLLAEWSTRWKLLYPLPEESTSAEDMAKRLETVRSEIAAEEKRQSENLKPALLTRINDARKLRDLRQQEAKLVRNLYDTKVEHLKHRVSQRIDLLEKYVFPILLGALGSLIYILRSQIAAIHNRTYTSHFVSLSLVRISLGTIAGLLGTLVLPPDALASTDVLPLAVPLLLGYSVEILFSAMDRVVTAFTNGQGKPA